MSDFLDEVMADCEEAETDLGGKTMTWREGVYPVAPSLIRRGAMLVVGGKEVEIKLTLRVRWSGTSTDGGTWSLDADALPKQGQTLVYGGKTYRIAQVNNAHEAFIEIDLMDNNR